jgi:hypothetical protein
MLPWKRLDGPAMAKNFISRRVQPCQRRVHVGYEYQGLADQTRMRSEVLESDEVKLRIGELFNLSDQNYSPSSRIQHAFKLIRPAPKVNNQNLCALRNSSDHHRVKMILYLLVLHVYGCMAWSDTPCMCP